jgi:ribosomal protein L37E
MSAFFCGWLCAGARREDPVWDRATESRVKRRGKNVSTNICSSCGFELQSDFRFCPGCGADLQKPIQCPNCGQSNEPSFKFCAECGTPLYKTMQEAQPKTGTKQKEAQVVEVPPPPKVGITIEFPFSTSQTFDFAVKEATKHPSFAQFGEGKKALHRVTYDPADILMAVELVEYLKGWRRRVFRRGQGVSSPSYTALDMNKNINSIYGDVFKQGFHSRNTPTGFVGDASQTKEVTGNLIRKEYVTNCRSKSIQIAFALRWIPHGCLRCLRPSQSKLILTRIETGNLLRVGTRIPLA